MSLRVERRLFQRLINRERMERGRERLSVSPLISHRARRQARRMASTGVLAHSDLNKVMRGVRFTLAGENIGVIGASAESLQRATRRLFRAFMGSQPHRRNLLRSRYQRMGLGLRYADGRLWTSHVFYDPD